jgi:hypothetical protein
VRSFDIQEFEIFKICAKNCWRKATGAKMKICGERKKRVVRLNFLPGNLYMCCLDKDVRLCVKHCGTVELVSLSSGMCVRHKDDGHSTEYTDVTDQYCLKRCDNA